MLFSHGIIPKGNRWGLFLTILWFTLPLAAVSLKLNLGPSHYNNYLIYKHVFHHLVDKQNLYAFYPGEHLYQNHYGPTFGVLIAPFAMLPDQAGGALWVLTSAFLLFFAFQCLPFNHRDSMVLMAKSMAHSLSATLVDDHQRELNDAKIEKIRQQLRLIQVQMTVKGIPPGSPVALRLFV
jgi:hypothetical protein